MKPWEEDWMLEPEVASLPFIIESDEGRNILQPSTEATLEDIVLAMAAPEMARALLEVLAADSGPNDDLSAAIGADGKERLRAALRKAGAL